ncbi:hypothetical protein GA830_11770 [Mesorhizobium sp. NBSH29]|nr:hypothetical protein GA830_11770 [Mesorhizobium sp. NBSH29]
MASSTQLLQALKTVLSNAHCVLVLGHNPGLEDLALKLAGAGTGAGVFSRMQSKFPTAALARFRFSGSWEDRL